ncbi:MAG: hypothetical protein HKN79_04370 [Flavobacteriales bacterium]|nr:hypothetical protein [Flavobacteriales bacterium]
MRILLLTIILSFGLSGHAQLLIAHQPIEQEPSYFISFDNDTIYGEVEYGKKLFGGLLNKIIFTDDQGNIFKLRANESNGFSINGQHYRSKVIDDFYYFLRPAVSGSPALYYLEHNYVKRESLPNQMIRMHGSYGRVIKSYVEMNGRMHKVYRKRFRKQAIGLFSAYPAVADRIFEGELDFYDLEEIITYCNLINDGVVISEFSK